MKQDVLSFLFDSSNASRTDVRAILKIQFVKIYLETKKYIYPGEILLRQKIVTSLSFRTYTIVLYNFNKSFFTVSSSD